MAEKLVINVKYNKSFISRIIQSDDKVKQYYATIRDVMLSYDKVKSRVTWNFDSINVGRVKLARFVMKGKSLYVYLNLDPSNYVENLYIEDVSDSKKYVDTPCVCKISSKKRFTYLVELLDELAEVHNLEEDELVAVTPIYPYESDEELLAKELIKNVVSKARAKKEVVQEVVEEVVEVEPISLKLPEIGGKKIKAIVNLDDIDKTFKDKDVVTVDLLKQHKLISDKANYVKVLARGLFNKNVTVVANEFSASALNLILLNGGKVVTTN